MTIMYQSIKIKHCGNGHDPLYMIGFTTPDINKAFRETIIINEWYEKYGCSCRYEVKEKDTK